MEKVYKVAGYVKLAKLWEKSKSEAIPYHHNYYKEKFEGKPEFELVDVFIDITGKKSILQRPQMISLIRQCMLGNVNCIATQSKAYLAANMQEFCYLLETLLGSGKVIDIVTEDPAYNIDTIKNSDSQKAALLKMAHDYIALNVEDYKSWYGNLLIAMEKLADGDS